MSITAGLAREIQVAKAIVSLAKHPSAPATPTSALLRVCSPDTAMSADASLALAPSQVLDGAREMQGVAEENPIATGNAGGGSKITGRDTVEGQKGKEKDSRHADREQESDRRQVSRTTVLSTYERYQLERRQANDRRTFWARRLLSPERKSRSPHRRSRSRERRWSGRQRGRSRSGSPRRRATNLSRSRGGRISRSRSRSWSRSRSRSRRNLSKASGNPRNASRERSRGRDRDRGLRTDRSGGGQTESQSLMAAAELNGTVKCSDSAQRPGHRDHAARSSNGDGHEKELASTGGRHQSAIPTASSHENAGNRGAELQGRGEGGEEIQRKLREQALKSLRHRKQQNESQAQKQRQLLDHPSTTTSTASPSSDLIALALETVQSGGHLGQQELQKIETNDLNTLRKLLLRQQQSLLRLKSVPLARPCNMTHSDAQLAPHAVCSLAPPVAFVWFLAAIVICRHHDTALMDCHSLCLFSLCSILASVHARFCRDNNQIIAQELAVCFPTLPLSSLLALLLTLGFPCSCLLLCCTHPLSSPHHVCSRPCTPQKTVRTMAMRTGVTGGGG